MPSVGSRLVLLGCSGTLCFVTVENLAEGKKAPKKENKRGNTFREANGRFFTPSFTCSRLCRRSIHSVIQRLVPFAPQKQ